MWVCLLLHVKCLDVIRTRHSTTHWQPNIRWFAWLRLTWRYRWPTLSCWVGTCHIGQSVMVLLFELDSFIPEFKLSLFFLLSSNSTCYFNRKCQKQAERKKDFSCCLCSRVEQREKKKITKRFFDILSNLSVTKKWKIYSLISCFFMIPKKKRNPFACQMLSAQNV